MLQRKRFCNVCAWFTGLQAFHFIRLLVSIEVLEFLTQLNEKYVSAAMAQKERQADRQGGRKGGRREER